MKQEIKIQQIRQRRKLRVRSKFLGTLQRPRVSVFRSLKHVSAQLIDDVNGQTLVMASDLEIKAAKKNKVEVAKKVGQLLAKKAIEKKISQVVFDRSKNKYHGRVKALAEGVREGGLIF